MKLKFKVQSYQTRAVDAVVDCFKGQIYQSGIQYRQDPGVYKDMASPLFEENAFKNGEILISEDQLLENIQQSQRLQNLPQSSSLVKTKISALNLDVEMETGTGKTY